MCGITGCVDRLPGTLGAANRRIRAVRTMSSHVAHRGPDEFSLTGDDRACLACNRLSIVGGPSGSQPFSSGEGGITVVCNGEIYNYRELRSSLQDRGHQFSGASDCEVIIHLYEDVGSAVPALLKGQFACAIWDRPRLRLTLFRDRFGICPLFWSMTAAQIVFASEAKAILASGAVDAQIDVVGLAHSALFQGCLAPRTIFERIRQVPPGHVVVVGADTWQAEDRPYWQMSFTPRQDAARHPIDPSIIERELHAALSQAVSDRMQGDSPVGVYLSGGVDSSTVASLARTAGADTAFSITFDDPTVDESIYQREVAAALRMSWTSVRCDATDIVKNLARAVWHAEAPLFRSASIPMLLLSERVGQEGFKVVLSGEGADELFLGYPDFLRFQVQLAFFRGSTSAQLAAELGKILDRPVSIDELHGIREVYEGGLTPLDNLPFLTSRLSRNRRVLDILRTRGSDSTFESMTRAFHLCQCEANPSWNRATDLWRAQLIEITTKLSSYLLATQGDRMSMASGVEQRFPFLDEAVVECALSMDEDLRLRGETAKYILRRVAGRLLPANIVARTKKGYLAPNDAALRLLIDSGIAGAGQLLSPERIREYGYFEPETIMLALNRARSGEPASLSASTIMFALTTQMLHLMFVEGVPWTEIST